MTRLEILEIKMLALRDALDDCFVEIETIKSDSPEARQKKENEDVARHLSRLNAGKWDKNKKQVATSKPVLAKKRK